MSKILVTGGAGNVGGALVRKLVEKENMKLSLLMIYQQAQYPNCLHQHLKIGNLFTVM